MSSSVVHVAHMCLERSVGPVVCPLSSPWRAAAGSCRSGMRLTLIRHAFAGHKRNWAGPDINRPLDERGLRLVHGLTTLLLRYKVGQIVSSPALRCRQTVHPLAERVDLTVETSAALGAADTVNGIICQSSAHPAFNDAVVCTHDELLQPLLQLEGIRRETRRRT